MNQMEEQAWDVLSRKKDLVKYHYDNRGVVFLSERHPSLSSMDWIIPQAFVTIQPREENMVQQVEEQTQLQVILEDRPHQSTESIKGKLVYFSNITHPVRSVRVRLSNKTSISYRPGRHVRYCNEDQTYLDEILIFSTERSLSPGLATWDFEFPPISKKTNGRCNNSLRVCSFLLAITDSHQHSSNNAWAESLWQVEATLIKVDPSSDVRNSGSDIRIVAGSKLNVITPRRTHIKDSGPLSIAFNERDHELPMFIKIDAKNPFVRCGEELEVDITISNSSMADLHQFRVILVRITGLAFEDGLKHTFQQHIFEYLVNKTISKGSSLHDTCIIRVPENTSHSAEGQMISVNYQLQLIVPKPLFLVDTVVTVPIHVLAPVHIRSETDVNRENFRALKYGCI
ncbi:hypothetical protein PROFUN_13315 [Planoprotostelium fungivorum]|uniref:Arrestin C-terminal-like domain-containing protein n=1 Tax=Planoprotostelium fungivorum TaxID=1890364 RepID=A0A2P6N457_9EUKA|nr:hypothetical protein PROFUN_13315 [Planoprotostelium fungivorum]